MKKARETKKTETITFNNMEHLVAVLRAAYDLQLVRHSMGKEIKLEAALVIVMGD